MTNRYYYERTKAWMLNNKIIVFLSLLSFCLFVSTLALAGQKNRLSDELADLRNSLTSTSTTTTTLAPVEGEGDNNNDNNKPGGDNQDNGTGDGNGDNGNEDDNNVNVTVPNTTIDEGNDGTTVAGDGNDGNNDTKPEENDKKPESLKSYNDINNAETDTIEDNEVDSLLNNIMLEKLGYYK